MKIILETSPNPEHQISALNDLIRINSDRITGYKKRADITSDNNLEYLFFQFIYQSNQNIADLIKAIHILGGEPADRTVLPGKFYHAWTDFKFSITKQDRNIMLDYCEYAEDVAKSAYQKVLDEKELRWENKKLVDMLTKHLGDLKHSHQEIIDLHNDNSTAA
ncbi:MAG: PA2169 family four-helix-bundle protein [Mucilaginibacter sp.]